MKGRVRWIAGIVLIAAALPLAGCGRSSDTTEKTAPSRLEPITDIQRVVLTEKAAERLGIQTVPVAEERVVRKRLFGGDVVALPQAEGTDLGPVWVRVFLTESDVNRVDRSQPTLVRALDDDEDDDEEDRGWRAEPDEGPGRDDLTDTDLLEEQAAKELYYLIDSPERKLAPGQAVLVELSLSGQETLHKVIPYAAVLYGVTGETWVYTNPEPLEFVRQPIAIDYIERDRAILLEGPEVGTAVVTVGAAELFGTETGVSK